MRMFERTTTREQLSNEPEWQKGYVFAAFDVSDVVVCEKGSDGDIGRMHLRSSCREIGAINSADVYNGSIQNSNIRRKRRKSS